MPTSRHAFTTTCKALPLVSRIRLERVFLVTMGTGGVLNSFVLWGLELVSILFSLLYLSLFSLDGFVCGCKTWSIVLKGESALPASCTSYQECGEKSLGTVILSPVTIIGRLLFISNCGISHYEHEYEYSFLWFRRAYVCCSCSLMEASPQWTSNGK